MTIRFHASILLLLVLLSFAVTGRAELSPDLSKLLESSEFVYVSSTRKDGTLSRPAEIWFMYHQGAVWVGTRPDSWRVKRIEWGRPQAKIWVGKPDGPAVVARGELVKDAAAEKALLETFAKKYPSGWAKWEKSFRDGFTDGSRVLVKYTPTGAGAKAN
jgi:general stress protein 26